jgi:hypothetical protein
MVTYSVPDLHLAFPIRSRNLDLDVRAMMMAEITLFKSESDSVIPNFSKLFFISS